MTIKTGRNEPCPCGSGKKFKKCCLGSQEVKKTDNAINSNMTLMTTTESDPIMPVRLYYAIAVRHGRPKAEADRLLS